MKKNNTFVIYFLRQADSFDRLLMALGFIGAVGDGLSMPVIMLMTSKLMNNLGNGDKLTFLHNMNKNAEILLFTSCGILLASFLEGYCWARTGERQARRLRIKYLKAILRQEVGYFDIRATTTTTQVITSVSSDSLVIQDTIIEKVPNFVANISMFVGGILFGFILQWRLALVAFPFILVLVAPGFMYGHVLIGLAKKNTEAYSKAGGIAEQAIASVKTVYSFVGEEKTVMEFSEALKEMVKVGRKQGLAKGIVMGGSGLLFAVWAFIFWYGSRLVMYHGAKGGNVFAVGVLVGLAGQALGSGLSNLKSFSEASSAGERIVEVVERVPDIDSQDNKGEVLAQVLGEVEFKNVEFKYPSRPADIVLRNLSLKIPAGRTLALVGGSGSGKSTIISLLQRFYNANKGEIRIDGVEIDKLQLKWLRLQMGLVSQEPSLFATSIKENIMFGKEGQVTMEEILEASENANAHNFISQLPQGYDTQVGERGVHMSGGQKQRIAIARALIRKPRILLLDEATSALDSESERKVQEALDKAASCITTVMIAHRLSTVRNADIIAVIQCGEVVEIGSHDELCKNPTGIYNSLLKLQQVDVNTSDSEEERIYHDFDANGDDHDSSFQQNSFTELTKKKVPNEDKQSKNPKIETPPFLKLLLLNLPELKQALIGCLGAAIAGGIQPLFGYCMGNMVYVFLLPNYSEVRKETEKYSLIFCGIAMVLVVVNIFQHSNFATMGEYLTKRIRENMLAKILTFEVEWFEQEENSTGAVCSRLAKDANMVRSLIGDRISLLLQTMFLVLVSSTMGIIIAWRLAVVIIATQPIIIVCLYGRMVLLKKMSRNSSKSQEESSKLAAEVVANIRTVTSFSSQDRILSMFERAQQVPRKGSNRQSLCAGVGLSICQAMISCNWALSFWYGGRLVYDGLIATKALLQTFLMLINTGKIIADVGCITTDLARGSDAVNSVFAVLNRHSKIHPDDPKGYQPLSIKGHIEFRDVHFVYPSRPNAVIFQSLSLVIDDGKSTALVGASGSGKSTIIALIERFHDPVQGSVLIDGIDLKSYKLRSLRKHMAMVSQEPTLFSGTIRENIMNGSYEKVDESEIISVAKAANAHGFITQLKNGYNTWCGEKGIQLSGGQKQRIAIARAILRNPTVLLLDEATSALDGPAERVVQDALERLMKGRTSVVVAHRLSTVQNCDQIVVMDKGAVVEKGTHATLLEKGNPGAYFSLISLQRRID